MKVGFISEFDVENKKAWSGTINFLYKTLSKEYELYPIVIKPSFTQKVFKKITKIIGGGNEDYSFIDQWMNRNAINKKVKTAIDDGVECFFAPAASTVLGVSTISQEYKVVYLSDATYHIMLGYYYEGGSKKNVERHNCAEKNSLMRANTVILSSNWAKNDAINYYGISEDKIKVLCFGANLNDRYKPHALHDVVRILFVGVEWKRKGTDIAIDCVNVLNHSKYGRKFELTIIGLDKPENYNCSDSVKFVGRLNKDNEEQYERMIKYFQESDLFLLPTLAECAGIVFSEAAMYGLPTFTHNTGGVMSYVEDGVTGRGLQLGSTGEDFANAILDMLNKNQYDEWSKNARRKYEKELNWEKWLTSCKKIIEE